MEPKVFTEVHKMWDKIMAFTDEDLRIVWNSLKGQDLTEEYAPGISMESWAESIYSEMSKRGMDCGLTLERR
jgi:hypothetical protein